MSEFAYVTDGACNVDDMLTLEITLYKVNKSVTKSMLTFPFNDQTLGWRLNNTVTANNWACTFLQLDSTVIQRGVQSQKDFHLPTFSRHEFVAVMQARIFHLRHTTVYQIYCLFSYWIFVSWISALASFHRAI